MVTDELLAEAEQRVSAAHKDAVDKGETERAGRLERTLGELADEMARRADETAIAAASEPGYAGRPGGAA